ncbi:MAG: four helix bundle protein [Firmicutes bacterium]|nr:four helix bundle protein [Bacillota bacterium]
MKDNKVFDKSKAFAIRIINLYKHLKESKHEFVMSNQILRSGTSIGANVAESLYASSRSDFTNKLSIALKEASETKYWLLLLSETGYISQKEFDSIRSEIDELLKLLTASVKTAKNVQSEQSDQ